MKTNFVLYVCLLLSSRVLAQNTGIGTNAPEAKLHVNGDLKLQQGFAVNKFSRDSIFAENSHHNVPTEKAIKDYLKKGQWAASIDSTMIGAQAPLARGFVESFFLDGPSSVAQSGNHAYVCSYNNDRLVSVHIGNPDSIYYEDEIAVNMDGPVDVHVKGNFAYVVSENNDRLCIYDISNPNNIIAKGFTSLNIRKPTAVFVEGNYAYVTSDLFNRLSIFDISNPNIIVALGFTSTNMSLPVDVFVKGNFAYLVSSANNRLCIYDVSNPNLIVAKGFTNAGLTDPTSLFVKDNYAYVLSQNTGLSGRIVVYNISNPDVISLVTSSVPEFSNSYKLSISGNALFVADGDKIHLYDISNPVVTRPIGISYANLNGATAVFANGDYAYVTSSNNDRLCIFDLNRTNNLQLTSAGIQSAPIQWQNNGIHIYRSNGNVGINTSEPLAPLHVEGSAYFHGNISIGIGTNIPEARIHLPAETGEKIILWGQPFSGSNYGIGVQSGLLQIHTNSNTDDIGFGYGSSNSFTELMRLKGNGNFGIGTNAPSNKLSINGNANITGNLGVGNATPSRPLSFPAALGEKILLYPGGGGEVGIGVYGNELRLHCDNPGSMVSFGTQDNAGIFTQAGRFQLTGGYGLFVNGNIWANGTTYASDERFKKNITSIQSPLEKLLQLDGVEYEMRTNEFSKYQFEPGKQMGLLAQNVEKIVPEAVKEKDGYKGVDYARLVPLLIEAIKELKKEIDTLKAKK